MIGNIGGLRFEFLGYGRLGFTMLSPNILGACLAMLFPLFLWGEHAWRKKHAGSRRKVAGMILWTLAGVVYLMLLARTYGRAGFLGLAIALGLSAFADRRIALKYLLVFAAVLCLTPGGGARMMSLADGGDPAVSHRFRMWEDGLVAIADHWRTGFDGKATDKDSFRIYYRDRNVHHLYFKTDNTYISDAMSKGIPLGFAEHLLMFLVTAAMFRLGRSRRLVLAWMMGCAMATYFFCCLWGDMSCALPADNIRRALFAGGGLLAWHEWRRRRPGPRAILSVAGTALAADLLLFGAMGFAAAHFAAHRAYHREFPGQLMPHQGLAELLVPESPSNDTLVIYLTAHPREDIPNRLREFCETGTAVLCIGTTPQTTAGEIREAVESVIGGRSGYRDFVFVSGGRNTTNLSVMAGLEDLPLRQLVFIYPVFDHIDRKFRVEPEGFPSGPASLLVLPGESSQNPSPLPANAVCSDDPDGVFLRELTGL